MESPKFLQVLGLKKPIQRIDIVTFFNKILSHKILSFSLTAIFILRPDYTAWHYHTKLFIIIIIIIIVIIIIFIIIVIVMIMRNTHTIRTNKNTNINTTYLRQTLTISVAQKQTKFKKKVIWFLRRF